MSSEEVAALFRIRDKTDTLLAKLCISFCTPVKKVLGKINGVVQAHDSLRHAPNFNVRNEMNRIDEDETDSASESSSDPNPKRRAKATAEKVCTWNRTRSHNLGSYLLVLSTDESV